jgi:hypothetical protein
MSDFQRQLLLVSLSVFAATGFLIWSVTTIRYHITATKLKVTWLGLPVRWIPLETIKHIGTRPELWTERWPNVLFDNGRTLVIRRRNGLFRSFLITPKYPFQFKASLEQARESVLHGPGRKLGRKTEAPHPGGTDPPTKRQSAA